MYFYICYLHQIFSITRRKKGKVANKPIYSEFKKESFFIHSFSWLLNAGKLARINAREDGQYLFVVRGRASCKVISESVLLDETKRLSQESNELKGLNILPSMFRPTRILMDTLENHGRASVGVARGQHSENVSIKNYQFKLPTQLIHHLSHAEYQKRFETLVFLESSLLREHHKLSADDLQARTSHLMKTGMGTYCKSGGLKNGKACQTIDCLNECPNAAFVADPPSLADIQSWSKSLRNAQAQGDFERERPERWNGIWLVFLVFTEFVEANATRGRLLNVWDQATALRLEWEANPAFVAPRPW